MSAVLKGGQDKRPLVALTEAVEFNPKPARGTIGDDFELTFLPMAAVEAASGKLDPTTIRRYAAVKKGFTYFCEGDVLFAKITPCMENGKMAVARGLHNGVGFGSTEFHVLRPREGIDPSYIYHFVSSSNFRRDAAHHMTGAVGQKRVPLAFLEQSQIPLPDIDTQRQIVGELEKQFSRLDDAVANLKRVKANLKRYKAAVLKAAVEGRLVPTETKLARRENRKVETGHQLLKKILENRRTNWTGRGSYKEPAKCAPMDVPEGWGVASLESITDSNRVICYGILMPKADLADGVLYVKVRDMKGDKIDLASLQRTSPDIAAKYPRSSLKAGDLLLSIRGTYGRVADVPPELNGGNITQDTARLDISKLIDSAYIAAFLRSDNAQNYFKRVARGVAVKGVNIGDLRPMPVPIPPFAEQRRIVAEMERHLSIARGVEVEVEANLVRAKSLRQTILQEQFRLDRSGNKTSIQRSVD